jgi:hypothetical protein
VAAEALRDAVTVGVERRASRKRRTKTMPTAATPQKTSASTVPTIHPVLLGFGRTQVSSTTSVR